MGMGKVAGTTLRPLPDGCELDAPSLDLSEASLWQMTLVGGGVVGNNNNNNNNNNNKHGDGVKM